MLGWVEVRIDYKFEGMIDLRQPKKSETRTPPYR
jgi:hypothetical protein